MPKSEKRCTNFKGAFRPLDARQFTSFLNVTVICASSVRVNTARVLVELFNMHFLTLRASAQSSYAYLPVKWPFLDASVSEVKLVKFGQCK